jgi:hypothetical protein
MSKGFQSCIVSFTNPINHLSALIIFSNSEEKDGILFKQKVSDYEKQKERDEKKKSKVKPRR